MKGSTIIAVVTGLTATLVSAQLETIPQCALSCAISSLSSTGCQTTDIACICKATGFITALTPCVQGACTAAEFDATIKAASQLCADAGVTLSLSATGSSATPSAPAATEASSSVAVTTEVSSAASSAGSTLSTATSSPTTTGPTVGSNGTATTTRLPPTPSNTQGSSASRNTIALGGLGAVLALVAALL